MTGELDVLRELLAIERERLRVARRIEEERSIVFPETSVIVRDVVRLLEAIAEREGRTARGERGRAMEADRRPPDDDEDFSDLE